MSSSVFPSPFSLLAACGWLQAACGEAQSGSQSTLWTWLPPASACLSRDGGCHPPPQQLPRVALVGGCSGAKGNGAVPAAFPAVRQGAGKVGFPVGFFLLFLPWLCKSNVSCSFCPSRFSRPLACHPLAARQGLVEQRPCCASPAFFTGAPVSDSVALTWLVCLS